MRILHLDSSALGSNSVSRLLTQHLSQQLQTKFPEASYQYLDLATTLLPHWHPNHLDEKDTKILNDFIESEFVILGAPMYNFSIPSTLKAWIDRISVAGKTFTYTEKGPLGLMQGKTVFIVSSRGGFYQETFQE